MANKKISGYTEKTSLASDDLFLIEQSAGTYRKVSSSTLTHVITSSVTYTIGSGGDFANFVQAMAYLKNKWIPSSSIVTLRLCSNLSLTTAASYNYNGTYAILVMSYPCSLQIVVDLAGYSINVGNGSDTVHGFLVRPGCVLSITSSAAGAIVKTNKSGYGYGFYANTDSYLLACQSGYSIQLGASGAGWLHGIHSDALGAHINSGSANVYYNTYGCYAQCMGYIGFAGDIANNATRGFQSIVGGRIYRNGCTGAQATDSSPAVGVESSDGSWVN